MLRAFSAGDLVRLVDSGQALRVVARNGARWECVGVFEDRRLFCLVGDDEIESMGGPPRDPAPGAEGVAGVLRRARAVIADARVVAEESTASRQALRATLEAIRLGRDGKPEA